MRNCINATVDFDALAETTKAPPKSLMRMFNPQGNPTAASLYAAPIALQTQTGVRLEVRAAAEAA